MSASHKKLRLMIERNGCTVEQFNESAATFISCTYFAPDGVHKSTARMSKFKNEGNQHGDKNEEASVRRFARQYPATQIAVQIKEKAPEVFKIVQAIAHPPREETLEEFARRVDAEHDEHDEHEQTEEPQATAGPSPATPTPLPLSQRQAPMEKSKTIALVPKANTMTSKGRPPEHMAKMREYKRLTMAETYRIVDWVKLNVKDKQYDDVSQVIEPLSKALGFKVPIASTEKAMKVLGLTLRRKVGPRGQYKKRVPVDPVALELMALEIMRLLSQAHISPSPEFMALVKRMENNKNDEQGTDEAAVG